MTVTPYPTAPPGYSETLPCTPESARTARRLLRTALAAWGQEELFHDGALIVTELAANAAEHSGSRFIRIVITHTQHATIRIGVEDKSHTMPVLKQPNGLPPYVRGHGLTLVDALTDRWGTDLFQWGKQVWAEVNVTRP